MLTCAVRDRRLRRFDARQDGHVRDLQPRLRGTSHVRVPYVFRLMMTCSVGDWRLRFDWLQKGHVGTFSRVRVARRTFTFLTFDVCVHALNVEIRLCDIWFPTFGGNAPRTTTAVLCSRGCSEVARRVLFFNGCWRTRDWPQAGDGELCVCVCVCVRACVRVRVCVLVLMCM